MSGARVEQRLLSIKPSVLLARAGQNRGRVCLGRRLAPGCTALAQRLTLSTRSASAFSPRFVLLSYDGRNHCLGQSRASSSGYQGPMLATLNGTVRASPALPRIFGRYSGYLSHSTPLHDWMRLSVVTPILTAPSSALRTTVARFFAFADFVTGGESSTCCPRHSGES